MPITEEKHYRQGPHEIMAFVNIDTGVPELMVGSCEAMINKAPEMIEFRVPEDVKDIKKAFAMFVDVAKERIRVATSRVVEAPPGFDPNQPPKGKNVIFGG